MCACCGLTRCARAVQTVLASMSTKILREGMEVADERTKLEADVVTGIEAVKTQAWERPFISQITAIRSQVRPLCPRCIVSGCTSGNLPWNATPTTQVPPVTPRRVLATQPTRRLWQQSILMCTRGQ